MLQQTQTSRVSEKFLKFIEQFPDFRTLAEASTDDVLKAWQGLGYNRRAIALKNIARIVCSDYEGKLPKSLEILKSFPQIGHNTASSILAFAFNKPTIFIETNIRRVYIYFFFPGRKGVKDSEILPFVKKTLDYDNPRKWYYALMDYGVMLKKTHPELNKRSAHYRKQKPFKGSNRQIRGKILKILLKHPKIEQNKLIEMLDVTQNKLVRILESLEEEGFLTIDQHIVKIVN